MVYNIISIYIYLYINHVGPDKKNTYTLTSYNVGPLSYKLVYKPH